MKKVLVVDDSTTMRRMVMVSLRGLSEVQFQEAGSGLEAIEQLALGPVDLMILDLNMPDIHGLEVVQFVNAHAPYRAIPIVVLTTRGDEGSRGAALAAVLPMRCCQKRPNGSPDRSKKTTSILCSAASCRTSLDRETPVVTRMLSTLWAETANSLSPARTRKRSPCLRKPAPKVLMMSCMKGCCRL
jgi:two-component system chemotaxis response regulator CheY